MPRLLVFALALVVPVSAAHQVAPTPQSRPLVFTHVSVIDVASSDARRARKLDQTVVISGDRIAAVGRAGAVRIPDGSYVVDASGLFLIPGLWDMHIHMLGNWNTATALDLFLANGVTGVRDMGSDLKAILALRQEIASGARLGPRMVVCGLSISGLSGSSDARRPTTTEDAREEVRRLKHAGVDFIKPYSYLSPAAFSAALDEAAKVKLDSVGHVPFGVRVSDAAKAGLKSIEHLEGVVIESSDLEERLREEIDTRIREGKQGIQVPQIETDQAPRYRDSYNSQRLQRLSARFVKYHTWHVPTFISPEASARVVGTMKTGFAGYPNIRYVPTAIEESWKRALTARFSPDQMANLSVYAAYKRVIATAMHRAGVRFLAGTDAAGPGQVPGVSLHDELAIMIEVGLSPLAALQTATINPALFLGREHELGTVERGKLADLVLLDADPLDDIDNARRISGVVVSGRYLGDESLRRMLAGVQANAKRP